MSIRQIVSRTVNKAVNSAGNAVSKASSLSEHQLEAAEELRRQYLEEMPDPGDPEALSAAQKMLAASGMEIFQAYLPDVSSVYSPLEQDVEYQGSFIPEYNIRCIRLTQWISDKKENQLEKLVGVYEVLSQEDCNVALIFHRTTKKTDVYLGVVNLNNDTSNVTADTLKRRLEDALRGSFPGSRWENETEYGIPDFLKKERDYSIASAANIPNLKSEKFLSQTIEKLLDGIVPQKRQQEYTLVLLASPVFDVRERKLQLARQYSNLLPFASWQTSYMVSESIGHGSSAMINFNLGSNTGTQTSQGTTNSTSQTDTVGQNTSDSLQESTSESVSEGWNKSSGTSSSVSETSGKSTSIEAGGSVGMNIPHIPIKADIHASTARTTSESLTNTTGTSESVGQSLSQSTGTTMGHSSSIGRNIAKSFGRTVGRTLSTGASRGLNFGAGFARTSSTTAMLGKNEGITQTYGNHQVQQALKLLEMQTERLNKASALGFWEFGAYVLSEDVNTANNVAHTYLALTQGEDSFLTEPVVNLWRGDIEKSRQEAKTISGYIRQLRHPLFGVSPELISSDPRYSLYPPIVSTSTGLTGKDLAYALNFPARSIEGLPVLQCEAFGRNVAACSPASEEPGLELGRISHMHNTEKTKVRLDPDSLTSHVFITGSTGSGKSNTAYQILSEASRRNIPFLVIEPAKGEYKNVFGNKDDVHVFGTNPKYGKLLTLNPFSFPDEIHVLEHIDRLVEIFNACWPMYAAMPAVLKKGIEESYRKCGWDLTASENRYGKIYPTFADLQVLIREIIETSDYDTENKGAYKGALVTRIESLANGLNGMIFNGQDIDEGVLFDQNTIVDLSRIGSAETKSLIMGMLVIKLEEYRMSRMTSMNSPLRHITVLEEAHHLLKNSRQTGSEQGAMQAKSVEMLANVIAQMRTYGESFMICDQAPGLLDPAVIRNTNTKILLRLPAHEDRLLAGRAAGLKEEQIEELSRLETGVAAVYQNNWAEAVLCKVNKADVTEELYHPEDSCMPAVPVSNAEKIKWLRRASNGMILQDSLERNKILQQLEQLNLSGQEKYLILDLLNRKDVSDLQLHQMAEILFPREIEQFTEMILSDIPSSTFAEFIESIFHCPIGPESSRLFQRIGQGFLDRKNPSFVMKERDIR